MGNMLGGGELGADILGTKKGCRERIVVIRPLHRSVGLNGWIRVLSQWCPRIVAGHNNTPTSSVSQNVEFGFCSVVDEAVHDVF